MRALDWLHSCLVMSRQPGAGLVCCAMHPFSLVLRLEGRNGHSRSLKRRSSQGILRCSERGAAQARGARAAGCLEGRSGTSLLGALLGCSSENDVVGVGEPPLHFVPGELRGRSSRILSNVRLYSRDGHGDCERHREADHASVRKFNMLTHHKCASTWIFERFIRVLTAALPLNGIWDRYRPGATEHRPA
jgi:hypothetical protein